MQNYYSKIQSKSKDYENQAYTILSFLGIVALSCASWYISYRRGLTVAYNDAMSHLDLSRLVIDNMQTGLSQIGSVWLPLNHILFLPFIWNDWAWHSGFAGSVISMAAYILSALGIYGAIRELTGKRIPAFVGGLAFALNLNMLYLQTTPLTEPLFVAFISLSVYYFIKFIKSNDARYLLVLGILGALQILTRYDGWFVLAAEAVLLASHQLFVARQNLKSTTGKLFLFAFPGAFAALLWLAWNWLIFGSPLYFAIGPYSARAQQVVIADRGGLITKGDLLTSLRFYGVDIMANVGSYLALTAVLGLIVFLFGRNSQFGWKLKALIIILLLTPVVFNVLSLYLGFSVLNLPELHWNPNPDPSGQWFNVRYGIMALPLVAILVGLLANANKYAALLITLIIFGQGYLTYQSGIVTIKDGTIGSSSFANADVAQALSSVPASDKVILSTSFFNAVAFRSGLPLHSLIHEGVSKEWSAALSDPASYAQWIVMANGSIGEPVYDSLVSKQQNGFLAYYKLFYRGKHADIYTLKTQDEMYVMKMNDTLRIGHTEYAVKAVDDPDLAYKSKEEIIATFADYEKRGINTVRFNAFGDGCPEGFQPASGILNEDRLKNMDFIVAISSQHHLRLIPVLLSTAAHCGGEGQYNSWIGQKPDDKTIFFTHPVTQDLFQNYLNLILSRQNTITEKRYSEEPAILAWEVLDDQSVGKKEAEVWLVRMTNYIESQDPNHLITARVNSDLANLKDLPEKFLSSSHLEH